MTQFETEVPEPLRDDLPRLLSGGRVTTPAIWVLLAIFIGKLRLEGATMQVQGDHIGRREGASLAER